MVPSSSVLLLEACCWCCMSPINAHYMPEGHLRSFTYTWYSAVWNMTARDRRLCLTILPSTRRPKSAKCQLTPCIMLGIAVVWRASAKYGEAIYGFGQLYTVCISIGTHNTDIDEFIHIDTPHITNASCSGCRRRLLSYRHCSYRAKSRPNAFQPGRRSIIQFPRTSRFADRDKTVNFMMYYCRHSLLNPSLFFAQSV